jgi:hypothetical protein
MTTEQVYLTGFLKTALSHGVITRAAPGILGRLMGRLNSPANRAVRPALLQRLGRVGTRLETAAPRVQGLDRAMAARLTDMGALAKTRSTVQLQNALTSHFYPNRPGSITLAKPTETWWAHNNTYRYNPLSSP